MAAGLIRRWCASLPYGRTAVLRVALLLGIATVGGCPFTGGGGAETTFSKSYGGPTHDAATVLLPTDDGGFLMFGQANASRAMDLVGGMQGDLWINKLDAHGNVEFQRLMGNLPIRTSGTTVFGRARATADGGTILVGYRFHRRPPGIPDDRPFPLEQEDVAVAKLDALGAVQWSHTYDSGPWPGYDYYATLSATATPSDLGRDVWPLPDGSFLVLAISEANLEDRRGVGFPCPLVGDIPEAGDPCRGTPPGRPGNRLAEATSVVVMKLDANGDLLWSRRLEEEAFLADNRGYHYREPPRPLFLLIRGSADGGALVVRTLQHKTLFYRLGPDGSHSTLAALPEEFHAVDALPLPNAGGAWIAVVSQTVGVDEVIRIAGDGEIEWRTEMPALMYDATLRCSTTGSDCVLAAVGDSFSGPYLAFLDESGEILRQMLVPNPVSSHFERIELVDGGRSYRLIGHRWAALLTSGERQLFSLAADGFELVEGGPVPVRIEQADPTGRDPMMLAELTPEGGMLFFDPDPIEQRVMRGDAAGATVADFRLHGIGDAGELAVAAIRIAPGRYVIAAERLADRVDDWLMRYDLDESGDRVAWQRRLLIDGRPGHVQALVPIGTDGDFVVASRHGEHLRLTRMTADGQLVWQSAAITDPGFEESPFYDWRELHATADGGVAGLATTLPPSVAVVAEASLLVRVDADGNVASIQAYTTRFESFTPGDDGGFLLIGKGDAAGDIANLYAVDATGAPRGGRTLRFGGESASSVVNSALIRRHGSGYVMAVTMKGLLSPVLHPGGVPQQPIQDRDLLLVQLDAGGSPGWARLYGALHTETARSLSVRDDGAILVAGTSSSLGDLTDAWLLKLGPDGMITPDCNVLLWEIPAFFIEVEPFFVPSLALTPQAPQPPGEASAFDGLPLRRAPHGTTARQCLGDVGPAVDMPPPSTFRLTVAPTGRLPGTVTSTPTGISCGTGLGDAACSAQFPSGTRVVLRADPQNFSTWLDPCEDGTGGISLECAVTLTGDRTVRVQFGTSDPGSMLLSVSLAGAGSGRVAGPGIDCPGDCSEAHAQGTQLTLRAAPDNGSLFDHWEGDCATIGDLACVVEMNGGRHVTAFFRRIGP